MEEHKLIIRPKTKVGELLDVYPELEDVLIGIVPAFKKLKNPVLRKTVARVTTLQQAAVVGKVKLDEILEPLRKAVGQTAELLTEEEKQYFSEKPEWFDDNKIVKTIDASKILNSGENPLGVIMNASHALEDDTILEIIHEFVPAPIIDELSEKGFAFWLTGSENKIKLYFKKR